LGSTTRKTESRDGGDQGGGHEKGVAEMHLEYRT
jgi:hypothetical protein